MQTELSVVLGVCVCVAVMFAYRIESTYFRQNCSATINIYKQKDELVHGRQMGEERRKLNTFYRLDSLGKKDPVPSIVLNVIVKATRHLCLPQRDIH